MNDTILTVITIIHTLFILFVVLTPFLGNNYFLLLHVIAIPFMMFHWALNDNHCFLTLVEQHIRKQLYGTDPNPNDMFMFRLVAPVYDFNKDNKSFSVMIWTCTIGLWLWSCTKLYSNWKNGKLSKWTDLFIFNGG